jgi:4-alpha-glucanotransferase
MNIELTNDERDFLREIFEDKQKHMIQEINHTDTIDYERMLKQKLELLEGVMRKLTE